MNKTTENNEVIIVCSILNLCSKCALDTIDCDCNHDWTKAEVRNIPNCDFCTQSAKYDAQTTMNKMWAFMCETHYTEYRAHTELGLGKGQLLVSVKTSK